MHMHILLLEARAKRTASYVLYLLINSTNDLMNPSICEILLL